MTWVRDIAGAVIGFAARAITGVRGHGHTAPPAGVPRVYFANHASHGDTLLLWATLPSEVRRTTRPVAGGGYWGASALRRFVVRHVFDALPIDRDGAWNAIVSLDCMAAALDRGESLILYPEGTRHCGGGDALLPFQGGLFYLGRRRPDVELVPAWIDNAGRALPKGRWLPVPILCSVRYGAALRVEPGEGKAVFIRRAEAAVQALRPAQGVMP